MNKYVNYYRVSTDKQGMKGLGIDAQHRMVDALTKDGIVVGEFTEVESRKNLNKPQLINAIALAQKEKATLIVAKLDRLLSDSLFLNQLLASELKFICADNQHATPMTLRFLAAVSQDELERVSQRTSAALESIKQIIEKQGYYVTKGGKTITSLGSPKMQNKQYAKTQMTFVSRNRVYQPKSAIGIELIKSYAKNGIEAKEIKQRLAANGIDLSLKTIYSYKKAV